MSRSNIIKENNKKLFESRLQMKPKSGVKRSQISLEHKKYNDNLSILNNSQPFTKIIFHKQLKNHSTFDNSFLKNINNINNSTISKKIIKINKKNQLNTQNLNINKSQNKSNILIKDITFFHLKKSPKNKEEKNKTLINVNKRITKQNSKNKNISRQSRTKNNHLGGITINIKKPKKNNRNINFINSITRSMTTINETNNITINNSNYIMNNTNININNINNGNNRIIIKEKIIPKFKITNDMYIKIPNKPFRTNLNSKRNESSSKKKFNRHNSFLMNRIQKIQKIKFGKRQNINLNLNNTNFNSKLNDVIFETNLNQKGRNSINLLKNKNFSNNKNTIDIYKGLTQRNLFLGKYLGKIFQKNKNYSTKYSKNNSRPKNQNYTLNLEKLNEKYEKDKNSNRNLKTKNNNILTKFINKGIYKNVSRHIKHNKTNKSTYNKKILTQNEDSIKNLINKKNILSEEFGNFNNFINKINSLKDIDKTEQIIEDDINATNTKINEDFFSTEKNKNLNETSINDDSGILSMNEVKDIIYYNDMINIRKEDNYLFNYNDYNKYIDNYKYKVYNKFFGNNEDNLNYYTKYNQNKLITKKKYIITKDNINNFNDKDCQFKNYNVIKIYSHNNSSKKK